MSTDKNNKHKGKGKKTKYYGLYIIFGVAIIMILYYLIFVSGIIAS